MIIIVQLRFMSHKSETHNLLSSFIKLVTFQFDQKVKKVQFDNKEEFVMTSCFFQENDIFHQTSYVWTFLKLKYH